MAKRKPAVDATEFSGAAYSHLYKEAADAGVAKRKPVDATEFSGAAYSHLYKEATDAGVAK